MPISPREQRILAAIEKELCDQDPGLVATFTNTRLPSSVPQQFPLPAPQVYLLILALLALVIVHILMPGLSPAGSAILTGALITPWMVNASRAARRRCCDVPAPPTDRWIRTP